jgi:hypothetical protein
MVTPFHPTSHVTVQQYPNPNNTTAYSFILVMRRFDRDGSVLNVGEAIKLRFPVIIAGLESA